MSKNTDIVKETRLERQLSRKTRLETRAQNLDVAIRKTRDAARYKTQKVMDKAEMRQFFLFGKYMARSLQPDDLREWLNLTAIWARPSDKVLFTDEAWIQSATNWSIEARLREEANADGKV